MQEKLLVQSRASTADPEYASQIVNVNGGYFHGEDAFLAPSVPSGTAAIGGVGMGRYDTAARVAKEILAREFGGVYVFNTNDRLMKSLEELGVLVRTCREACS